MPGTEGSSRHGTFADIYAAVTELDRIEEKEGMLAWATSERCVEQSIANKRAERRRVAYRRGGRGVRQSASPS